MVDRKENYKFDLGVKGLTELIMWIDYHKDVKLFLNQSEGLTLETSA